MHLMTASLTAGLAIGLTIYASTLGHAAFRGLAATNTTTLRALHGEHCAALSADAIVYTGGRIYTTGPGSVGVLVGQRRRGGRIHGSTIHTEN